MERNSKGKFVMGNKAAKKPKKRCLYPGCDVPITRKNKKYCTSSHRVLTHLLKKRLLEEKV